MDRLPIIHSYTRADAIADGVLIDVTNEAREAGFKATLIKSNPGARFA